MRCYGILRTAEIAMRSTIAEITRIGTTSVPSELASFATAMWSACVREPSRAVQPLYRGVRSHRERINRSKTPPTRQADRMNRSKTPLDPLGERFNRPSPAPEPTQRG
jgi:hypothetical protein